MPRPHTNNESVVTILRHSDYVSMPWKNGLGVTRELFRENDPSGEMLFRISMARVADAGPFSHYQGYNRVLINLGPGKMELANRSRGEVMTLEKFDLYQFSGGDSIDSDVESEIQDFNVFSRADLKVPSVGILKVSVGASVNLECDKRSLIFFSAGANVEILVKGLGAETFVLNPNDSVMVQPREIDDTLKILSLASNANEVTLIQVTFDPI